MVQGVNLLCQRGRIFNKDIASTFNENYDSAKMLRKSSGDVLQETQIAYEGKSRSKWKNAMALSCVIFPARRLASASLTPRANPDTVPDARLGSDRNLPMPPSFERMAANRGKVC